MMDPVTFPEPLKFDPGRYLLEDGTFQPHPKVIPFGLGRRRCLGETMARMELYIFFTTILSRFTLEKSHPKEVLSNERTASKMAKPVNFKIRFISR